MPITVKMEIKRSFVLVSNQELNAQKTQALLNTAATVQAKAKQLAAKPTGFKGRGVREGKLVDSIRISEPYASESGKSTMIRVYADDKVAPHAKWQEAGTGEYGPMGRPIVAKMHWVEKAPPYRGQYVMAKGKTGKMVPRLGARGKRGEMKGVWAEFDQFATRIHGSHPKWFMRDAGRSSNARNEMRNAARRLARGMLRTWPLGAPWEIGKF